ncbi:prepilin-type N-terminal cleavage/methylation domain-containing protein [Roseimicrobium gellanilyticum]|uniref:Prepilin-type N-terminal cleavage/methylation domain-containing protein n=1 Tax=Roseimicrobium gellanilyticum TaxID=748857 RepID=A0A366HNF3_9BACT|nr:type II secretion system protein [Roseimicrobium gellanilyticum]RBP43761.1 prepilin-type N-terminal cleavage/methylation domain-containing protein [Roseimicrobium gellanilyticum]
MKIPALRSAPRGWTLIELLIVVTLVAVLATLAFPLFGYFRKKAQFVSCVSHLRVLHGGFMAHMMDNDMVWPQVPEDIFNSSDDERMWRWYFETLKPYGIGKPMWTCPADVLSSEEVYSTESDFTGSYIPTMFDERPNTAFLWGNQPWLIERGEMHGKGDGPNIVMPDGTVRQGPSLFPK